jgi:hypothetical protein
VIHQPVQIEKPLVDDVLVAGTLVFENDRAPVLVQAKRIYAPAMGRAELGSVERILA